MIYNNLFNFKYFFLNNSNSFNQDRPTFGLAFFFPNRYYIIFSKFTIPMQFFIYFFNTNKYISSKNQRL